jgi:hypothetical protein
MNPHCTDCGAKIPVPLTRDNGDPTSSDTRALHAAHRTRCDKCAHAERLRVVKRLGSVDHIKSRAMRQAGHWAPKTTAAQRHAERMSEYDSAAGGDANV